MRADVFVLAVVMAMFAQYHDNSDVGPGSVTRRRALSRHMDRYVPARRTYDGMCAFNVTMRAALNA